MIAGLGVQRVEHRLDQDEVDAALQQRLDLLAIDSLAACRSRLRESPGSLTSGESDSVLLVGPSAPATKRGRPSAASAIGRLARDAGGGDVDLAHQMLGAIIRLADPVGVEGVGRDDIRAGRRDSRRVIAVDDVGPGQVQKSLLPFWSRPRSSGRDSRPRRAHSPGSSCRTRRRSAGCAWRLRRGSGLRRWSCGLLQRPLPGRRPSRWQIA